VDNLLWKLELDKLARKAEMDMDIVGRLRSGVTASPLVDEELKELPVNP
jgi:hypothetical protein